MKKKLCSSRGEERRGGAQEKAKDRMKLSLPPKLVKKTSLGPKLYFVFVKVFHFQLRV